MFWILLPKDRRCNSDCYGQALRFLCGQLPKRRRRRLPNSSEAYFTSSRRSERKRGTPFKELKDSVLTAVNAFKMVKAARGRRLATPVLKACMSVACMCRL